MNLILVIMSAIGTLLVAIGRFTVPGRKFDKFSWPITYEAFAHVFVGFLFGLVAMQAEGPYLFFFIGLLLLEIVMFILVMRKKEE